MSKQRATRATGGSPVAPATGFVLASGDYLDAGNIESALARNRAFAAAGGHQGAVVFPKLRLFVITCLDPRVDPAHFLGLGLSDAMVVRNVGGRVTSEVINDVAFIVQLAENVVPDGPLFEVAVIHHTQCGTGALADDAFRYRYGQRIGAEESALRQRAVLDPAATVTFDVERLRAAPAISGRIRVSGFVYDVVTGLVEPVIPSVADDGVHHTDRQVVMDPSPSATSPSHEQTLRSLYQAFNKRDIDAVLAAMSEDVDWPNAWEGGRVHGKQAVRAYWTRQWQEIDPKRRGCLHRRATRRPRCGRRSSGGPRPRRQRGRRRPSPPRLQNCRRPRHQHGGRGAHDLKMPVPHGRRRPCGDSQQRSGEGIEPSNPWAARACRF